MRWVDSSMFKEEGVLSGSLGRDVRCARGARPWDTSQSGIGGDGASSEHKEGGGRDQEVNSHGVMRLEN